MKCKDVNSALVDRLLSCELASDEYKALCSHLESCARCREEIRSWGRLEVLLSRIESPDGERMVVQPVPDLTEEQARQLAKKAISTAKAEMAKAPQGTEGTAEITDTVGERSRPSGVLARVRLFRNKQPVAVSPENMDWVGKPGWELGIGIQEEGTYEVAFEGDRAPTDFGAKDMQELISQPGSEPLQRDSEAGAATEARSGPRGLFRLKKDSPQTTPSGGRIPAKLRIIFSRNILRGPENE